MHYLFRRNKYDVKQELRTMFLTLSALRRQILIEIKVLLTDKMHQHFTVIFRIWSFCCVPNDNDSQQPSFYSKWNVLALSLCIICIHLIVEIPLKYINSRKYILSILLNVYINTIKKAVVRELYSCTSIVILPYPFYRFTNVTKKKCLRGYAIRSLYVHFQTARWLGMSKLFAWLMILSAI